MTTENLALVLVSKDTMELQKTAVPHPKQGEVQLAIHSVGICGSDVSIWQKGYLGRFVMAGPLVQGHEGSGVVTAVGPDVTSLAVGDRVCLEPGMSCGSCDFCVNGPHHLCPEHRICSMPPTEGFLQRLFCHPAKCCFKLPDNVSLEEGALFDTLAVAVRGCKKGGASVGDNVLVCGAGPVGLCTMLTLKAMGVSKVCITDVLEYRVQNAKALGADEAILVDPTVDANITADTIRKTLGAAPNVTYECSGSQHGTEYGLIATKTQGQMVFVGLGSTNIGLPLTNASFKEITMHGSFSYTGRDMITALELVKSGKVDVKPLVRNRFPLEQGVQAFETVLAKSDGVIKAVIQCNTE